jgi:uncharacterized membrane protein YfcA
VIDATHDPLMLGLLSLAALATAILSAIVGMAGGITLLSVMLLAIEPLVAIPLHGAVQLVSNSSRAVIQRDHLRWDIISRFCILLLPMGFVGLWIAQSLPAAALRTLIGVFVLAATWLPQLLLFGAHPERLRPERRFLLLGGVAGLLNVTIGATGPLIAPFFLDMKLTRFALIGTKAACQTLGHLAKLIVFGVAGFVFADYWQLLLLLSAMAVLGTAIGSRLLHHVSEKAFVWLYRGVLTLIALRLAIDGGIDWLGA